MTKHPLIAAFAVLFAAPVLLHGQNRAIDFDPNATSSNGVMADTADCSSKALAERSFCLEQVKTRLEEQKLEAEIGKQASDRKLQLITSIIQTLGISVPIVTALLAAFFTQKARREEDASERQDRKDQEKFAFSLKAAEIALNSSDSGQVWAKAKILASLFPDQLPVDFASDFDPLKLRFGPGGPAYKIDLLRLLAQYPEQANQLLAFWGAAFPGDRGLTPQSDPDYRWFLELVRVANLHVPNAVVKSEGEAIGFAG